MRLKYKKIIITILLVIELIMVHLTYQSFLQRNNYNTRDEVKNKNKQFAVYLKNGEEYEPYQGTSLYPKGYYLNKDQSYCLDMQDNKVEDILEFSSEGITVTSNKTVYCTLYFDPYKEEAGNYTFYIKENTTPKYTSEKSNPVTLSWEEEGINEYCLSEEDNTTNCIWQKVIDKSINTNYTFKTDTNEEKTIYAYLKSIDTIKKASDKIIYDTEKPTITSVKKIYDLWGSNSYSINSTETGYAKDYGVDGTWISQGNDPSISINDVSRFTNITGGYFEVAEPFNKDIYVQFLWANNTAGYHDSRKLTKLLPAGETKIIVDGVPEGEWTKVRFDIGIEAGLSYKIKHLGILTTNEYANNDDVILELTGTTGVSGVDKWEYTYTNGSNWTKTNGDQNITTYMTYSDNRMQNTYLRLCSKSGLCSDTETTEIKIDTVKPTITSIKKIYDLWGGTPYIVPSYSHYDKDYGIDGTWVTNGNDPSISFEDVSRFKNITGGFVELDSPLSKDINIQLLWANTTAGYSGTKCITKTLKAGETKLLIEGVPDGEWTKIRFDIGTQSGLSYKIKHLGILSKNEYANNDNVILELIGTVGDSGIDKWEYTYTDGSNWTKTNGDQNLTTYMTYSANRMQNTYLRLCSKAGSCSDTKTTEIKIDTVKPTITSVKTIYDLWGGTSYIVPSYAYYAKDYGIDGTWVVTGYDPAISFEDVSKFKNITGGFIELASPLSKDIQVQFLWANNTLPYHDVRTITKTLKAGQTKILLEGVPSGDWTKARFDIGSESGLSYKIKHLGILASDGQANNDDIILELIGTVGASGIDKWQYTYTDGSGWTNANGEVALTSYMTYSAVRNQNTYLRLCSKAGSCSASATKKIYISK